MRWPPKLTKNDRLSNWLNQLLEACKASQPLYSNGTRLQRTPQGTFIQAQPGSVIGGLQITRFIIAACFADYITGYLVNAAGTVTSDTTYYIAKPYYIQKTPWHNQTLGNEVYLYTSDTDRTVRHSNLNPSSLTTYEEVWPPYVADQLILAADVDTNVIVDGTRLTLQEIHPARIWRVKPRAYDVCVDGTTKQAAILAGPPSA